MKGRSVSAGILALALFVQFSFISAHAATLGAAVPFYPTGDIVGSTITFTWKAVPGATKYFLKVNDSKTAGRFTGWYTANQLGCAQSSQTCSITVSTGFAAGPCKWLVRTGNADGAGPWSNARTFKLTNETRIPIASLPFTVSASGSYYLAGNLTHAQAGTDAITVNADHVTIDLMGYSLIGPGKTSGNNKGVFLDGRNNVEIKNGTIRDFGTYGIYSQSSTTGRNLRIIDVRAIGNGNGGIILNGRGHLVERCNVSENGWVGIMAHTGSTITGNTASDNGSIGIFGSQACTITGNTSRNNVSHGISAHDGCTVKNNTSSWNQQKGIELFGSNLVDGNTAYANSSENIAACTSCVFGHNAD
jgi:parallel beta-helix repeat protein